VLLRKLGGFEGKARAHGVIPTAALLTCRWQLRTHAVTPAVTPAVSPVKTVTPVTRAGNKSTVLIAATNRPQDLDAALLSRFELSIAFPLPEPAARKGIFALYARHLDNSALDRLASISDGASGRDIRDVCEAAERRWAARRVRKESVAAGQPLPPIEEYAACMQQRSATHEAYAQRKWRA